MTRLIVIQAVLMFGSASLLRAAPVSLFDGKSLTGWETRNGEEKWWKIEEGMITGGSLLEEVPFNTFITSDKSYGNFELSYRIRLVKGEGFINSGMQIRSQRSEKDSEMIGYQIDAGAGYWGDIYDESRRNIAVAKASAAAAKDWEWNDYRIRCEGPRIRTWINGVQVNDYTEKDAAIPQTGLLGLQAHGGGKFLVQMKDISINELPSSDGSRSPEAQRASFKLPAGYKAELVASEEQGVGKPITVTWDRHGRMWTMTALEYPVDANENEEAARELYKSGGKDRVLVFDEPNQSTPQTPRVFADKLAIPLGVLPTVDGVLVQHGSEIRRYRDKDGDGKADGFEVVLEGFGIQDSHLFPHQFERAPGGWIYLAQGAFNYSKVTRPGGFKFNNGPTPVDFNNCKLARFRPDGSDFEPLTGGPNNIWGLSISRTGETFIQEANDMGCPVAEFEPGTNYLTFSSKPLRDDAPVLPPSTPNEPMGGTGLSGLALAEDKDTPFAKAQGDGQIFYIANPITSKIQVVSMTRDAKGHPVYKKGADFMTTDDAWFRPIAIHFGPDGCLYVVDWYNKIISHNEVPRVHPDRDKTRGRIWRIRHESQKVMPRRDLTKISNAGLADLLGSDSARTAAQAWQEIVDRKAVELTKTLETLVMDSQQPTARRCGALWALEGLDAASGSLLAGLATSQDPVMRYEAIRIAGGESLAENDFLAVVSALGNEGHFRVRAGLANAVRAHRKPTAKIMATAARLGLAPPEGDSRDAYDRKFERYLARWAMSNRPEVTREMLASVELPIEARLLAVRSFANAEAAAEMVKLLPSVERPLNADELALLGSQLDQPSVQKGFGDLLADPVRREAMLRVITRIDPKVAAIPTLAQAVEAASLKLLEENRTEERQRLVVELARRFRLRALTDEVNRWLAASGRTDVDLAEGLGTLREIGAVDLEKFRSHLDHADAAVRREAVTGFASAEDAAVIAELGKRWAGLSGALRSLAVNGMTSGSIKAEAFANALADGDFSGFDGSVVEKLIAVLGAEHPSVIAMLKANDGLLRPVLRLDGGSGRIVTGTTLKGPFTIETWIRLDPGISNQDALLGRQDGPDFNFAGEKLRIYGDDEFGDLIIANRSVKPDVWTHCAITRDAENRFTIYLDGEPDAATGKTHAGDFENLNLAEGHRGRTSAASYEEFRIWNSARTADEIRRDFRTSFAGTSPQGLVLRVAGDSLDTRMDGSAKISLTRDFPELVTTTEAAALEEKFTRFRTMAAAPGDVAKGRELVESSCMICHQIHGAGTAIGPNLSGAGAMGTEALLRNILTPNAQLESGYYRHDVKLRDGSLVSGFLANETDSSLTLRQIGTDERVISRTEIDTHEISRRSLMPEGLIEGFSPQQITDLFTYLKSLR
jgi:putative membrane-bound dehydrogenase-like protein